MEDNVVYLDTYRFRKKALEAERIYGIPVVPDPRIPPGIAVWVDTTNTTANGGLSKETLTECMKRLLKQGYREFP